LGSLSPVAAAPATLIYTVRDGDTLWAIANHYGVSIPALVRANHLVDENALSLGEKLTIPQVQSAKPSKQLALRKHLAGGRNPASSVHPRRKTVRSVAGKKFKRAAGDVLAFRRTPATMLELRGAWIATHTMGAPPGLLGSFTSAEHLLLVEASLTRTALRYLGVPYVWGGESFYGVDCSGFVQAVFRHNGIELPRTADAQFEVGRRVLETDLRPGDLVFFQTYTEGASHVGIYLGGGRFVHASASNGVRIDSLSDGYYATRYLGARRDVI
jgi:cell wall-associated NlpC family hydrolase